MSDYIGHGGKPIVERVLEKDKAKDAIQGLTQVPVRRQIAHEAISLSYGFFTPLEGFMTWEDVNTVCTEMRLSDGTVWSIPILFDMKAEKLKELEIKEGDSILLTYMDAPLAIMDVGEIYDCDKLTVCQAVYGTTETKHPGVRRTMECEDKFLAGKITLVNEPKFNEPYKSFWKTPKQHIDAKKEKGWEHMVAHQTRNVPHTGHEWLMKGAWFAANEDLMVDELRTGVLVNCIIGEKRVGDYIDEAILLAHNKLNEAGYFRPDVHMVTFTLWDMRYAGPREAIFHAALRTNLGCTHHMFGRDHAGVGDYYDTYAAHHLLKQVKDDLRIKPVFVLEWWYCPVCAEVTCSALCGHTKERQKFSGTLIRSIIMDGVKPTRLILRPEVFDTVMECAEKYGFGSPFVTEKYLAERQPIFTLEKMEVGKA